MMKYLSQYFLKFCICNLFTISAWLMFGEVSERERERERAREQEREREKKESEKNQQGGPIYQ